MGIKTCQKSGTARTTKRGRYIEGVQPSTVGRKLIEVRRSEYRISVTPERVPPVIIGENE
jgi:hypothetical protein